MADTYNSYKFEGGAGAVAMSDTVNDGYNHMAVWAKVSECGGSTGVAWASQNDRNTSVPSSPFFPDGRREISQKTFRPSSSVSSKW